MVTQAMPTRPPVAVLMPEKTRVSILSPAALETLAELADVRLPTGALLMPEDIPALLDGAVACITGWGTPPLRTDLLAQAQNLRLVAHTAGSIRKLVPLELMGQGLRVSHAAGIIADAVAEFVVIAALLGVRPLHEIDRGMRAGADWLPLRERNIGRLLGACSVGVIGAGYVGRKVIHLFRAFGSPLLVHDPLLSAQDAAALGVSLCSLDALLTESEIVSLHAPILPETRGMIGAAQLARLRDGALFINSARASLVDEAALLAELRSGRISAALDVFASEPLPSDSPFRTLSNAILSPHSAGHTADTYFRQGAAMVDEVHRFLLGAPLQYQVSAEMLPTMA